MKRRVLFVTTVPVTLRAFLLPFAEFFRGRGWQVDAMAHGITSCIQCEEAFDNTWDVSWNRNPLALSNFLSAPRRIRELVRQYQYDLVHVHTPVAAFVTRYAVRSLPPNQRPKVIYTAHGFHFHTGNSAFNNSLFIALEKLAGRWTDYLVVINREDEAAARRYGIVPEQRIRYMPGIGVDTERFSPEKVTIAEVEGVRHNLNLSPSERLFLMVAEFNNGKRHADALRAFALLNRKGTHIAFAGAGPLQDSMHVLARDLGVEERVHFLGFRTDIPALMRASVATVLPSEREGLPRSVMESLCLAVPVIGSDVRGVRDLLATGGGRLVGLGDVSGIASGMAWVLDHPVEASNAGLKGRQHMKNFDIAQILDLHAELYSEAVR